MKDGWRRPPLLNRVYSSYLDSDKKWWALNTRLCGKSPTRFARSGFSKIFPFEIKEINAGLVHDENGAQIDHNDFLDGGSQRGSYKKETIFVGSTLCVLGGILRQNSKISDLLSETEAQDLIASINRTDFSTDQSSSVSADSKTLIAALKREINRVKNELELSRRSYLPQMSDIEAMDTPFSFTSHPAPMFSSTPMQTPATTQTIREIEEEDDLTRPQKKRKIHEKSHEVFNDVLNHVSEKYQESLGRVLAHQILSNNEKAIDLMNEVADVVIENKGVKEALLDIFSEKAYKKYLDSLRVPDWVLLYFKLQAKIPDNGWQSMINLTCLGRTKVSDK
jgi:hypothetical protein